MNNHLTARQVSEWVLGDRSREAELHFRACPSCQEEIGRLEASLRSFRSSVRHWSEDQLPSSPVLPQAWRDSARSWVMGLCWAAAAIVLCLLIGRLTYHPIASPTQTAAADAVLLAQIDQEVSQTVPDSMEPLTQLVSWDRNASASKNDKPVRESQAQ
jgi:hypothetical protein